MQPQGSGGILFSAVLGRYRRLLNGVGAAHRGLVRIVAPLPRLTMTSYLLRRLMVCVCEYVSVYVLELPRLLRWAAARLIVVIARLASLEMARVVSEPLLYFDDEVLLLPVVAWARLQASVVR